MDRCRIRNGETINYDPHVPTAPSYFATDGRKAGEALSDVDS